MINDCGVGLEPPRAALKGVYSKTMGDLFLGDWAVAAQTPAQVLGAARGCHIAVSRLSARGRAVCLVIVARMGVRCSILLNSARGSEEE